MEYLTKPRYDVCDAHIHIRSNFQSMQELMDLSKRLIDERGLKRINSLNSGAGKGTAGLVQQVIHACYKVENPGVAAGA